MLCHLSLQRSTISSARRKSSASIHGQSLTKTGRPFLCQSTDSLPKVCRSNPRFLLSGHLFFDPNWDRTDWRSSFIRSFVRFGSCAGRIEVCLSNSENDHVLVIHQTVQSESKRVGCRNTLRSTCDPRLFQPRSMGSWTASCTSSPV